MIGNNNIAIDNHDLWCVRKFFRKKNRNLKNHIHNRHSSRANKKPFETRQHPFQKKYLTDLPPLKRKEQRPAASATIQHLLNDVRQNEQPKKTVQLHSK